MKNEIIRVNQSVFRILEINGDKALVIDCLKVRVPTWVNKDKIDNMEITTEAELCKITNVSIPAANTLSIEQQKEIREKYASISLILPIIGDDLDRNDSISYISKMTSLSRKTIIRRLWTYLVYQNICAFLINKVKTRELTQDEKDFRYIINKYYLTKQKRTLANCYLYLLRERHSDENGKLRENYPSIHQFRHFWNKYKRVDSLYISREGRSAYDANYRPLLGRTTNVFTACGIGMVDSTTLDLYVLNPERKPVRPIFSACIDAYSTLCLGFSISFTGGNSNLLKLILNTNADKAEYCKSLGIDISVNEWNSKGIPHKIITDNGSDYTSQSFTSLTTLGIEIITNKSHSPQSKPQVEVFFRLMNELLKPYLFYDGFVDKNNADKNPKREAIFTLKDIEYILAKTIIFYNSGRIIKLPYGKENIRPFACALFADSIKENPHSFVETSDDMIKLLFLPRTVGKFTRFGLKVGKLFYRSLNFVNEYLNGSDNEVVAYSPDDCSKVFLIRDKFYEFTVVDKFFADKKVSEAEIAIEQLKRNKREHQKESIEAKISLGKELEDYSSKRRNRR